MNRRAILALKLASSAVGLAATLYGLLFSMQATLYAASNPPLNARQVFMVVAGFTLFASGLTLALSLPQTLRFRFPRRPFREAAKPVYGFGSLLAIGVGATLGSPLFVLIPENIEQYTFVSLGALTIATILSVLMAKVYGDMYINARRRGLEAVGGPSFVKLAYGARSVRYFVSRFSMWVANVTLAAYSKIVLVLFTADYFPPLLQSLGLGTTASLATTYFLLAVLIAYTVASALYEKRLLRATGTMQIVLSAALVGILVYESLALGDKTGWNMAGLLKGNRGVSWVWSLIIDTGYLYLLFYGFQEIQSLEKYTYEENRVPILSALSKRFRMDKPSTMKSTMILSVVIAAAINILYALAVYSAHPSVQAVEQAAIPAFYLAQTYLGRAHELLMAVAFLIATFTTFVPAFLAASKHLSSLCEDGYMPKTLMNYSWIFTLAAILILALGNQDFLVNVISITALISLGVITLSATALADRRQAPTPGAHRPKYDTATPRIVGYTCFVAAGAIYFIDPSVTVFGALAILLAYLVYDVYRLGYTGTQLFLFFLTLTSIALIGASGTASLPPQRLDLLLFTMTIALQPQTTTLTLLLAALTMLLNVAVDRRLSREKPTHKATPTNT